MQLSIYQKDLTAAAASYLTAVKLHLRVDHSTEDTLITNLIKSGIEYIESETDTDFVQGTYDYTIDAFPSANLYLPRCPLSSVTSVKYYDIDNVQKTWTSTKYHVITRSKFRGYVCPIATETYPSTYDRPDAIVIRFVAGATTPPNRFLHALNLYCGIGYENRQDNGALSGAIDALINSLSVIGYA